MSPDPGETGRRACHASARWVVGPPGRACPIIWAVQPRPDDVLCGEGCGSDRVGGRLGLGFQGVLDVPRDFVDRLRVLADRVEGAVLAPAGDVRDRLAAHIETDRTQHAYGHAVHEHLAALATPFRVAEAMAVSELVHQGADLAVGGPGGDDDPVALWVTPAARAILGEVANVDGVAERLGVGDQA